MAWYPPISPLAAGLACKCPRCGQGKLFSGFLKVADTCPQCGLDYSTADSGDGPAVFLLFIVGFIGVVLLAILKFGLDAPEWVSLLVPLVVSGLVIWWTIRPLKAYMIALQYANKAREGRLEDDDRPDDGDNL